MFISFVIILHFFFCKLKWESFKSQHLRHISQNFYALFPLHLLEACLWIYFFSPCAVKFTILIRCVYTLSWHSQCLYDSRKMCTFVLCSFMLLHYSQSQAENWDSDDTNITMTHELSTSIKYEIKYLKEIHTCIAFNSLFHFNFKCNFSTITHQPVTDDVSCMLMGIIFLSLAIHFSSSSSSSSVLCCVMRQNPFIPDHSCMLNCQHQNNHNPHENELAMMAMCRDTFINIPQGLKFKVHSRCFARTEQIEYRV